MAFFYALTGNLWAQGQDEQAVYETADDYFKVFYEGDLSAIDRSFHPSISKYGFYKPKGKSEFEGNRMTLDDMKAYATKVKQRPAPKDAPREIELLEVNSHTAVVKVTGWWGYDYMLLGKEKDKWYIFKILWQSPS